MAKPTPSPTPTTKIPTLPDPGTFFGDLADRWHADLWLYRAGWLVFVLVVVSVASSYGVGYTLAKAVITRNWELARSVFQAARIRRRWRRVSQHLKLVLTDRTEITSAQTHGTALPGQTLPKPKTVTPRLRVKADEYGVICTAKTLPGVGLEEWQKQARHLADEWNAVRVAVTQIKAGRLRIRAVRVDPLAIPSSYDPVPAEVLAPVSLDSVFIGYDEYAERVDMRLNGVSGICVCGLAGSGKTSFLNNLIVRLGPHSAVQFIGLDGKSTNPENGDYGPVMDRFAILQGDDIEKANKLLKELDEFRESRADSVRRILGVGNAWNVPFTPDWPLIIIIIDECHTFFSQVKDGGDKDIRRRNAFAAQNEHYVSELVRKGRSVGMITIVATQKGTGDAIPTIIRDNCSVSLAFACRTIEASIAALGEEIRLYPGSSPVKLQGKKYVGVATMKLEDHEGYSRVRMPYVQESTAAAVAQLHAGTVRNRGEIPVPRVPAAIGTTSHEED